MKAFAKKVPESVVSYWAKKTPPWGPLGYISYKRTYSRLREDLGRTEEWVDTVHRCLQGLLDYGMAVTDDEVEEMFAYWFNLKCTTSGRGLWQLGTTTVAKVGGDSLQSCWFTLLDDIESFCFLFDQLMLGGGVGFSVLPSVVHRLPHVVRAVKVERQDDNDVDFIVPDNRQGWVELLRRVLKSFFETGKDFTYSCRCIRSKGAPIRGFGGTASGPDELSKGVERIAAILSSRAGKHIEPINALDIANIIGSVVVAGNVRRSAQLAIGHASDYEFLRAKDWGSGTVPNWRAMSNNTCCCNDVGSLPESFWNGYQGEGEPYGLFNLNLCRKVGRLADGENYRTDARVVGLNPCAEILLEDGENCCLVDVFLPNLRNMEEFRRATVISYKMAKTMVCMKFSWAKTQEVTTRNRRIGVGTTGWAHSRFIAEQYSEVYKQLENTDREYSKLINTSVSIKLSTVKPSGTVSLLPGVTPGIHPAYSPYYIRRIRFAADDPVVEVCRRNGYFTEPVYGFDGKPDYGTTVVEFPVKAPEGARVAREETAISQLEAQRTAQHHWSDNSVSCTIYYRLEELPSIRQWLKDNYTSSVKSVSFLLHSEHGFQQAPYEEISESDYLRRSSECKPITSLDDTEERDVADSLECRSGMCPVK